MNFKPITSCFFKRKLHLLAFLVLIILLGETSVFSGEIKVRPAFSVRGTYDDNINFTQRNKIDDYITTIIPSLDLTRVSEKSRMEIGGSVNVKRYSKKQRFNKTNQHYNLAFDYIPSPLFTINADGSFTLDTTTESELEETGLRYEHTVDRKAYRFQPGFAWSLSEVDSLSLNAGYSRVEYDEPFYLGYDNYSDYDSYNGALSWSHALSKDVATFFVNGGYSMTSYERDFYKEAFYKEISNETKTDKTGSYSLYSGFNFSFSPKWSLNLWAGARRTISDYYQIKPDKTKKEWTDRNWGGIGNISIRRSFERGYISAELSKDIIPSGRGETLERDLAGIRINYGFTKRLNGALSGSWSSSESERDHGTIDEDYYSFTSSLTYQVLDKTTAELSYSRYQSKDHSDFSKARRDVVFIQITTHLEKLL
ncbi:MAG: hypothetical protein J7L53_08450 [Deltaproteobacteria bacterium]|nr:hypothetical protein [Deltaproteobacteria bacterium]